GHRGQPVTVYVTVHRWANGTSVSPSSHDTAIDELSILPSTLCTRSATLLIFLQEIISKHEVLQR
ncbi:hypothetical protein HAX54_048576, partial [Datura stramonium]|nr:hypothetical protein [Datura stramonium]